MPALPVPMFQDRKVTASAMLPFRSPKGSSRIMSVGPNNNASVFVLLLIRSARMVSQSVPPFRLYCHVPRLVLTASMAMASTLGRPFSSMKVSSTASAATVMPAGLVAPSATDVIVGDALISTGNVMLTCPRFCRCLNQACNCRRRLERS
ncbi:hypothetical protein EEB15_27710 [Ramlibacter sp. WS9]|nr:hypothetical protein EEB15_27710 [Ramlibacter sp. WS9]